VESEETLSEKEEINKIDQNDNIELENHNFPRGINKLAFTTLVIMESLILYFSLTYLDILSAFNSIQPNVIYYIFKSLLTGTLWSLLFVRLLRLKNVHFNEEINSQSKWLERVFR